MCERDFCNRTVDIFAFVSLCVRCGVVGDKIKTEYVVVFLREFAVSFFRKPFHCIFLVK